MGLAITVGYLADMLENDEEGAAWFREEMQKVNLLLTKLGLRPHAEPEDCSVFSVDMFGYSGLHYLRRIAAHLNLRGTLPSPGDVNAAKDPIISEYNSLLDARRPSFLGRLFGGRRIVGEFDHLLYHSDAEGYYLPQEFKDVIFPPDSLEIPGAMIGSSYRLLDETSRLASVLELPIELDPESQEVWEAAETQGEGTTKWKRYGVESYVCLRLHHAAKHSIQHGAAIVFT